MTQQVTIKRLFSQRLREASRTSFLATVKTVNADDCVCVVETEDGISYDEVLLRAVTGVDKGILIVPTVGSHVMVSRIGGSNELYVSMFSEIDNVGILIKDAEYTITDKGYRMNVGSSGLKKSLTDLIDAITKMTVTTGVGPSGTPINAADFIKIKQDLNNFLED